MGCPRAVYWVTPWAARGLYTHVSSAHWGYSWATHGPLLLSYSNHSWVTMGSLKLPNWPPLEAS